MINRKKGGAIKTKRKWKKLSYLLMEKNM
jgi:hypothetical protein